MNEDYVSYEQAYQLKQLGFDWECNHYYGIDYKIHEETSSYLSNYCHRNDRELTAAPTLSQAQKWLREVKKIYVFSHIIGYPPRDKCKYYWKVETNNSRTVDSSAITELSLTYEKALSAGIDKALQTLNNYE